MFSLASIRRWKPCDFKSVEQKTVKTVDDRTENVHPRINKPQKTGIRVAYFANYEQYSTFTPDEYERPGMRFPFYNDDD